MDERLVQAARTAFPASMAGITLGAPMHGGECLPEPLVRLPLATMNRHGLIAGATGTGKTKTLQLAAEQLSAAGVPVFVADVKGDLAGIAAPGATNDRVAKRATETGYAWSAAGCPVEFLSLTGKRGAQLRATARASRGARAPKAAPSAFEQIMKSPVARTVAAQVTRGLLGALLGPAPRRRRRY
jgi:uncharacterized protein